MPISDAPSPFLIGGWRVDAAASELSIGQRTVRLEPKCISVLNYLASRPLEVVPREDLINAVWPDVVVTDASLTRCVSQLRQVLHDDPRNPRIIETSPRIGYRLLVKPEAVGATSVFPDIRRKSRRRWSVAAIVFGVAAIVTAVSVILGEGIQPPLLVEYRIEVDGDVADPVIRYTGDDGELHTVESVSFPYTRSVRPVTALTKNFEIKLMGVTRGAGVRLYATARRGGRVLSESTSTGTIRTGDFRDFSVYTFVTLDG